MQIFGLEFPAASLKVREAEETKIPSAMSSVIQEIHEENYTSEVMQREGKWKGLWSPNNERF